MIRRRPVQPVFGRIPAPFRYQVPILDRIDLTTNSYTFNTPMLFQMSLALGNQLEILSQRYRWLTGWSWDLAVGGALLVSDIKDLRQNEVSWITEFRSEIRTS